MTSRKTKASLYGIDKHLGDLGDHPQFRLLNDDKLARIHEAVVEVLGTIGIKVMRQEAIDLLQGNGCTVTDGDVVRIPRRLIEDAIASAPKRFTIYNREGEEALHLGSTDLYTRTGYTPLEFFDLDTGKRRDYRLEDFRVVARVADALPNVDQIGQAGVCRPTRENPLEVINHLEFDAMLTNSSKPIQPLVANAEILEDCYKMAEAVAVANGAKSLRDKPFVMPMLNNITPLLFNDDTIDKLFLTVDRGLPVILGPMPLAGGTAPATLAGTITLSVAESLAGLVIAQLRKKGTPYVMITFATTVDMRTGEVTGGPEGVLLIGGVLEMGHYYGIPISGGGIGADYRGTQSAGGSVQIVGGVIRTLLRGNAGVGVGGGSSLQGLVAADEQVGMLRAVMKGIPVDDEQLAIEAIREVGAGGGTFLGSVHTFRHMRDYWEPTLTKRQKYEDWVASGQKSYDQQVEEKMRAIMASHKPKPIPAQARKTINDIIANARRRVPVAAASD